MIPESVVLSLRISLFSPGVSQKPFLDMIFSISSSLFCLLSRSKIAPELFQPILKRLDPAL